MVIFLVFAVVYLVCTANQHPSKMKHQIDKGPSEFSGNFHSTYLACSDADMTKENGLLRNYMRNIRYYLNGNNSRQLSTTFHTREYDDHENHTVVAQCIGNLVFDKQGQILIPPGNPSGLLEKGNGDCTVPNGFWALTTRFHTFPNFLIYSLDLGKRATSSTLDSDSQEEYLKVTNLYNIPPEDIRDMTKSDSCPS